MDIVLMARMRPLDAAELLKALRAAFEDRQTHPLPSILPDPPATWTVPFRRLAVEVGLESDRMDVGTELARRFLDPLLQGRIQGFWDPEQQRWLG